MTSENLLDRTRDFNGDLCRNIVSLRQSVDLFDDLTDGEPHQSRVATAAEMRVKSAMPSGVIARGFHYTTAVEYPFETEPYLQSRYGNGTYGVWYGATEAETTVYETVYHMFHDEMQIEGLDEVVVRERAVYDVHCQAVLIDLSDKRASHPDLVADHYAFTQSLAQRLVGEGHPGLLAPSARCTGTVAALFSIKVLRDPRIKYFLLYRFNPGTRTVVVERTPGKPEIALQYRDGRLYKL